MFTDSRDGKTYKIVKIGTQTWMAENLNYSTSSGSWCYDNNTSNCIKFGRLYDWETAINVCPDGWHLPSDTEWSTLTDYIGSNAGNKLKSTSGWYKGVNGTDFYGFAALSGGYKYYSGGFKFINISGKFWSSTETKIDGANNRELGWDQSEIYRGNYYKDSGFSVRCIKDN